MSVFDQYEVWFVTGAQLLYGGDAVIAVDAHSNEMVAGLNACGKLPVKVVYKGTVNSSKEVTAAFKAANNDEKCVQALIELPFLYRQLTVIIITAVAVPVVPGQLRTNAPQRISAARCFLTVIVHPFLRPGNHTVYGQCRRSLRSPCRVPCARRHNSSQHRRKNTCHQLHTLNAPIFPNSILHLYLLFQQAPA